MVAEKQLIFQAKARLEFAVQDHLNNVAATAGYGTARTEPIVSACSFAGAPNPYQAEGAAFIAYRGAVWARCYELLDEVVAGTRAIPTEQELIALLPEYV